MNHGWTSLTQGSLYSSQVGSWGRLTPGTGCTQANTDYHDITSARLVLDSQQAESRVRAVSPPLVVQGGEGGRLGVLFADETCVLF